MWCENCQQEVPGIAAPGGDEEIQCARCGEELNLDRGTDSPEPEAATEAAPVIRPPQPRKEEPLLPNLDIWEVDDWRIDDHLADARLLVAWARQSGEPAGSGASGSGLNAREEFGPRQEAVTRRADVAHRPLPAATPPRKRRPSFMAWMLLSLGMMTLACGGVLMGLSFAEQRPELWTIGLPLVIAGQAGLVLGLIFQLLSIWRYNRLLAKIEAFEQHYEHVPLGMSHSAGGQNFYTHMAEGANPQMLLADLKNQMDLLSLSLKQRR